MKNRPKNHSKKSIKKLTRKFEQKNCQDVFQLKYGSWTFLGKVVEKKDLSEVKKKIEGEFTDELKKAFSTKDKQERSNQISEIDLSSNQFDIYQFDAHV